MLADLYPTCLQMPNMYVWREINQTVDDQNFNIYLLIISQVEISYMYYLVKDDREYTKNISKVLTFSAYMFLAH